MPSTAVDGPEPLHEADGTDRRRAGVRRIASPACPGASSSTHLHAIRNSTHDEFYAGRRIGLPPALPAPIGLSAGGPSTAIIPRCSAAPPGSGSVFLALGFFWGSSYLWIKIGLEGGLPPLTLIAGRLVARGDSSSRRSSRSPARSCRAAARMYGHLLVMSVVNIVRAVHPDHGRRAVDRLRPRVDPQRHGARSPSSSWRRCSCPTSGSRCRGSRASPSASRA